MAPEPPQNWLSLPVQAMLQALLSIAVEAKVLSQ